MLDFSQKRKLKKTIYHPAMLLVMVVLLVIMIHSTYTVFLKKLDSDNLRSRAESQLANLESRQAEVESNIQMLATPLGKEAEIRSKFNVVKGDENLAIILNTPEATATAPAPKSLWQKFIGFFTGR